MKNLVATTLGVVLAAGAVSAFAGSQDRENLTQCKADVKSFYGEDTRMRLRSIKRSSGQSHLRLMVTPQGGDNTLVVCSVTRDGVSTLADRDGVALAAPVQEEKVSLAE